MLKKIYFGVLLLRCFWHIDSPFYSLTNPGDSMLHDYLQVRVNHDRLFIFGLIFFFQSMCKMVKLYSLLFFFLSVWKCFVLVSSFTIFFLALHNISQPGLRKNTGVNGDPKTSFGKFPSHSLCLHSSFIQGFIAVNRSHAHSKDI